MDFVISSFENQLFKFNFVSKAKTLKEYLWVQLGGQGAHRFVFHREFLPTVDDFRVELFMIFSDQESSILANNKCVHVHDGASGSSTISDNVFVFDGMFVNLISGNLHSHWHVYCLLIIQLFGHSIEMVKFWFTMVCWLAVKTEFLFSDFCFIHGVVGFSESGFQCLIRCQSVLHIRLSSPEKSLTNQIILGMVRIRDIIIRETGVFFIIHFQIKTWPEYNQNVWKCKVFKIRLKIIMFCFLVKNFYKSVVYLFVYYAYACNMNNWYFVSW